MTTLFICALILFTCCSYYVAFLAYKRGKQITQLAEDLKHAENLVTYYKHIIEGFHKKMKENEEEYSLIQADYCTSESDYTKYSSQKAMENAIRSKMAMLIGNDIVKKFEPRILPLGEGKKKYSLVLKVKKI